jgi:hypothetical protein
MKIFIHILTVMLVLPAVWIFQSCMDNEPEPSDHSQGKNKFNILPSEPTTKDEVRMVVYDCKYNVLASVTSKGKDITVKKRFNSQMKWPCVLHHDTIPLGKLKQGNYTVVLLIVDTNPAVTDSIYVQEVLSLRVDK